MDFQAHPRSALQKLTTLIKVEDVHSAVQNTVQIHALKRRNSDFDKTKSYSMGEMIYLASVFACFNQ
jgi:hypothetical protein